MLFERKLFSPQVALTAVYVFSILCSCTVPSMPDVSSLPSIISCWYTKYPHAKGLCQVTLSLSTKPTG